MFAIVSLLVSIFSALSASNPAAGLFMYYWLYFNGFFSNPIPTNPVADVVSVIEGDSDMPTIDDTQQTQPAQDTTVADEPQTAPETTVISPEGDDTTPEAPAGIGFDANPSMSAEEEIVFNELNTLRKGAGLGALRVSPYIQSRIHQRLEDCFAPNVHQGKYEVFPGGFREVMAIDPDINHIVINEWWNADTDHRLVVRDKWRNERGEEIPYTYRFVGIAVKVIPPTDRYTQEYCAYAVLSADESP